MTRTLLIKTSCIESSSNDETKLVFVELKRAVANCKRPCNNHELFTNDLFVGRSGFVDMV